MYNTPVRGDDSILLASVVVPWWDHSELLELWDINLVHLQNNEIIFVDNGSNVSNKNALREFCERHKIKLIRNEENKGFATANNQALAIATGEYIVHLNNDVEIFEPPVECLCRLAGEGISGPGPMKTETGEVFVAGWALCIKKSTLQALGGWCEEYGVGYWDDVDLCCRARLAGYPVTAAPKSQFFCNQWLLSGSSKTEPTNLLIRHLGSITSTDGRVDRSAISSRNRDLFQKKFYLELQDITREINLIIFPDWRQPQDLLYQDLVGAIATLANHPDKTRIALLVDTSNSSTEEANLILSDVTMSLLFQDNLDVTEDLAISLLRKLENIQWKALLPYIHWRIALKNENNQGIVEAQAEIIPSCKLEDLSNKRAIYLEDNAWEFN